MHILLAVTIFFLGGVDVDDGIATHYHGSYGWGSVPHVALPKWKYIPRTASDAKHIGALRRMPRLINVCNVKSGKCEVALGVDFCGCGGTKRKGDERIADMSFSLVERLGLNFNLGVYKTQLRTTYSADPLRSLAFLFTPAESDTIGAWQPVPSAER